MENGVVNVASELFHFGVATHVACLAARGSFADRLPEPNSVTVLGKREGFSIAAVLRLAVLIQKLSPDLIHTHNLGPLVYAALATLGGFRRPLLHGEHGQIQVPDQTPRRLWLRRRLYGCCKVVHTVSQGLKETLSQSGFNHRSLRAIVNGVDCVRFNVSEDKVAAKAVFELPPTSIVLGIVGRFVALKRHRLLLDALRTVMAEFPAVHLLVAGDHGPERDSIVSAMREHPFAAKIHWLGMTNDMAPCYRALDLLVVPSEIEGLSNAVLEAMASGVPVLAHGACGNAEAVTHGESGFLHDIKDAPALVEALRPLLREPSILARASVQARTRALDHFSIASMASSYLSLYCELARKPVPAHQPSR
ncbi:MAG: glycosyltransferase [Roseimicrobium sp.]